MVWFLFLLLLFQLSGPAPSAADGGSSIPFRTQPPIIERFFRMGDGEIHIRNVHNGLQAKVRLLERDGSFNEGALEAMDKVFGFSSRTGGEHVSLRLLFLLDYFSDRVAPGKVIQLTSGYRDPEYNQSLRKMGRNVALTSTHMDAMAIDFFIENVNGKALWEMIRKENCCGVGHYGGRTIHMDSGRPRFWEAATSKVSSGESELNRRIYLTTQYDRYRAGEVVRLSLASISDFGFGVVPDITLLKEDGTSEEVKAIISGHSECVIIHDGGEGRSLRAPLPNRLSPGRYRMRVQLCNRPFQQMPEKIESNLIEVVP